MNIKPHGAQRLDGTRSATRFSALSLGLGAFFSSLLIYAGTVTSFLRYDGITRFVSLFSHTALIALLLVAMVLAIALLRGLYISPKAIMGVGGVLYVLGAAAFSYLTLATSGELALVLLGSAACGAGSCLMCLAWLRLCGRFTLGSALLNVSGGCIFASISYFAMAHLAPLAGIGIFMTCSVVAVVAPLLMRDQTRGEIERERAARPIDAPTTMHALGSFFDVIAKPALGLLVFSYVMGLTCQTFVDVFNLYLMAAVISAACLGALALIKLKAPLTRLLYRDLMPLFAIVTLAVPNVAGALVGQTQLTMFFTLLLYTFAAFLTLATLCAIANAAEFSTDFIGVTALVLFAGASIAGLASSEAFSPAIVSAIVTVVTTLYAFLMVAWRDREPENPLEGSGFDPALRPHAVSVDSGTTEVSAESEKPTTVTMRCDQLAEECALTAREREILGYLAECRNASYISEVLFISPNTVRTHIHNMYRKLGAASREDVLKLIFNL